MTTDQAERALVEARKQLAHAEAAARPVLEERERRSDQLRQAVLSRTMPPDRFLASIVPLQRSVSDAEREVARRTKDVSRAEVALRDARDEAWREEVAGMARLAAGTAVATRQELWSGRPVDVITFEEPTR